MANEIRKQVRTEESAQMDEMWSKLEEERANQEREDKNFMALYLSGELSCDDEFLEEVVEEEPYENNKSAGSLRRHNDNRAKSRKARRANAAIKNLNKRKADAKSAGRKMAGKPDRKIQKAKDFIKMSKKVSRREVEEETSAV